ncbi:alpha/beta fold hydrolase [Shewanella woodyi]|uniref:alpha/beta fold hydrolase n=1 Tax=Shewanella woodyi TaxID=60961 RepID=UPI0037494538
MRIDTIYRYMLLMLLVVASTETLSADSWLDKVKSGYKEVENKITTEFSLDEKTEELALAKPLPLDVPANWHYSYFNEPIFNSQMVILEDGVQHRKTIVLVHGLGELGMKDWFNLIPKLAEQYHVIAVDLPGFGLSGVPQGRYTPTNYAKVLNAVLNQYVDSPTTLVGHSMGGAISLRFASMYPDSVDKLVLIDVAGVLEKTAFIKHISELPFDESLVPNMLKKTIAQVNDFGSSLVELGTLHDPASDFLHGNDVTWNALLSNSPNINAALSLVEEDFNPAVRNLTVDTSIIWGAKDTVAPIRTAKVLSANIESARLAIIENASHVPMKSHPQEFMVELQHALASKTVKESIVEKGKTELSQGDLVCDNKANMTYSGKFDAIILNQCTNIKLKEVTATSLEANDSLVEVENLLLVSNRIALKADESVIRITNGVIKGDKAISLSGSRLDLAGVEIIGGEYTIYSDKHSQVVFSICKSESQQFSGLLHGVYELTETTLDELQYSSK